MCWAHRIFGHTCDCRWMRRVNASANRYNSEKRRQLHVPKAMSSSYREELRLEEVCTFSGDFPCRRTKSSLNSNSEPVQLDVTLPWKNCWAVRIHTSLKSEHTISRFSLITIAKWLQQRFKWVSLTSPHWELAEEHREPQIGRRQTTSIPKPSIWVATFFYRHHTDENKDGRGWCSIVPPYQGSMKADDTEPEQSSRRFIEVRKRFVIWPEILA